jgi:hypothetical protein
MGCQAHAIPTHAVLCYHQQQVARPDTLSCAQVVPICLSLRVRCYRRFLPILDLNCWQNVACDRAGLFLQCFRNFGKRCLLLLFSCCSDCAWVHDSRFLYERVSPGEVLSLTRFSSVKVHFSVTLILEHSMHATCMSELSGQVNPVTNVLVVRQKSFQDRNSSSTASKNESQCTFDTILYVPAQINSPPLGRAGQGHVADRGATARGESISTAASQTPYIC